MDNTRELTPEEAKLFTQEMAEFMKKHSIEMRITSTLHLFKKLDIPSPFLNG